MKYDVEKTRINGLTIIIPNVYYDERGTFIECFNHDDLGITSVQDNLFISKKDVLRGIHYQKEPQAKLVYVIKGSIFDVAVDLRKGSETYCQWEGIELSDRNHRILSISEGFAHGYYTLEENTVVMMKLSTYWKAENEIGIPWNDPSIGIEWPGRPILAEKDKQYIPLENML